MVKLTCTRCGKVFDKRCNLINHLSRKIPCLPNNVDISIDEIRSRYNLPTQEYKCQHCEKVFTTHQKLKHHADKYVCRKSELVPQSSLINHINHITNINNINNINVLNIHVNTFSAEGKRDFGKERWDHITMEHIYSYFCDNATTGLAQLMDDMYFNEDLPENQTVKIHPNNPQLSHIVRNGDVIDVPTSSVTDQIRMTGYNIITYHSAHEANLYDYLLSTQYDDMNTELKTQQDHVQSIQHWTGLHMVSSSRNSKRRVQKINDLITAHLQLRATQLPQARLIQFQPKTCNDDEIIPPDADKSVEHWQKSLMLCASQHPISYTLCTQSCAS